MMLCIAAGARADSLIGEHGKYSDMYGSDWSRLPNGRAMAAHDLAAMSFQQVNGESARRQFRDQAEVHIGDRRLKVRWREPECDKYGHTLFYFENCERVVIEELAVIQADSDFRASSTLFFEACGYVEIRNCLIAGTCGRPMIRLEGCEEYLIDRVEIAGVEYPECGLKSGAGIFINNGAGWDEQRERPGAIYARDFRELKWGVIQNCYIHGHPNLEPDTNHDGILFHAPADGIVFNCVFENYEGDSCLDISHRRDDPGYQDHHFRIERCVFRDCHRVKTNGASGSRNCSIIWCNNLYINSMLTDYHVGWPNWHVHETYVYDGSGGYFLTMHCRNGATLFRNCLLYCPVVRRSMYEPWGREGEAPWWIQPDYFVYAMPAPGTWLRPRGEFGEKITDWQDWQSAGYDGHSILTGGDPGFVDRQARDYRLMPSSIAVGAGTGLMQDGSERRLPVNGDFYGRPRPEPPACGAFEPIEKPGGGE